MKAILPIVLFGLAGFVVGVAWPRDGWNEGDSKVSIRRSPRHADDSGRFRAVAGQSSVQAMHALAKHATSLTPTEWPAFFRARMNDPDGTRLVERLWAEQDPAGFWDWIKQQHDGNLLNEYGRNLLRVWAVADPDAAMTAANAITDKESSDYLRREVIDSVITTDLTKGLDLAAKALDFNRFSWGPRDWMKRDPAAAVQGLAALPERSEYRGFLKYAVVAWAEADMPALMEWVKAQATEAGEEWYGEAFKAAAGTDTQTALEAASGLGDPNARDTALAGVLASGSLPFDQTADLLKQLSLPKRAAATLEILSSLDIGDAVSLEGATRLLIEAPASRNLLQVTGRFSAQFPDWKQGAAWAATLPDAAMRRRVLNDLASAVKPDELDDLAAAVATAPTLDLSDELFRATLKKLPADQKAAWLAKLPSERAAWGRAVFEHEEP